MGSRKKKTAAKVKTVVTIYRALNIHEKIALKCFNYHYGRRRLNLVDMINDNAYNPGPNEIKNRIFSGMEWMHEVEPRINYRKS